MAKEFFTEADVEIPFSPLGLTHGITSDTAVAAMQQFDISTGAWAPDWKLTPVVLRPWLDVTDPDGFIASGAKEYANPRWYAVEDGVETEVTTGTDYNLMTSAGDAGVLVVRRNVSPGSPLTLRFEGEFADTRTGHVHRIVMGTTLVCESVATPPVLTIDQPATVWYYPVRAASHSLEVNASLMIGATEAAVTDREFVWERMRDNGSWTAVGTELTDYDVDISADGSRATVRMDLMGSRLDLRVRARYDPSGNPSGVTLTEASPMSALTVVRRLRRVWPVILGLRNVLPSMPYVDCRARLNDGLGDIDDAEKWFSFTWQTATGTANGSVAYGSSVATGQEARIPTAAIAQAYGGKIRVGASDRGWLRALTVGGSVLTVGGKILVAKG